MPNQRRGGPKAHAAVPKHPQHAPESSKGPTAQAPQTHKHDIQQQQRLLNIFKAAFPALLSSPPPDNLTAALQRVKQALFDRDFAAAFGSPDNLEVYAARWSPTRALCYAAILTELRAHLQPLYYPEEQSVRSAEHDDAEKREGAGKDNDEALVLRIISLGGGAAEVVAVGGLLSDNESLRADATLVDSGPWGQVVTQLQHCLTQPPPLSSYASATARAANKALVEPASRLHVEFVQKDALTLTVNDLTSTSTEVASSPSPPPPCLVTLLFTLNELFTASSIGPTSGFLLRLAATLALAPGSLLLVVDSPGSYSETRVSKQARRYPMHWLLDKLLLPPSGEESSSRRWEKLEAQESAWFRLPAGLDYPIPLEDMRYQMHLYRFVGSEGEDEEQDEPPQTTPPVQPG